MTNELTTYDALPAYEQAVWHDGKVNPAAIKWGGKLAPPHVGTEIVVTMWTTPGRRRVTGYFTEGGWLGLLVRMYTAPDWHRKKNRDGMAYIFGPEFRLAHLQRHRSGGARKLRLRARPRLERGLA